MPETLHQMAARMCTSVCDCRNCPIVLYDPMHEDNGVVCAMVNYDDVEEQIAKLQQWAKENPPKGGKRRCLKRSTK